MRMEDFHYFINPLFADLTLQIFKILYTTENGRPWPKSWSILGNCSTILRLMQRSAINLKPEPERYFV